MAGAIASACLLAVDACKSEHGPSATLPSAASALPSAGTPSAVIAAVTPQGAAPSTPQGAAASTPQGPAPSTHGPALLSVGAPAPDVKFTLADGSTVRLLDLKGQVVVVYFYPEDDTSGCTVEAQEFTELEPKLRAAGAKVFGVSTQSGSSHSAFAEKYRLTIPLVADEDARVAGAFGVPVTNGNAKRVTFVIGGDLRIARVWGSVTARGHASEVLEAVLALRASPP